MDDINLTAPPTILGALTALGMAVVAAFQFFQSRRSKKNRTGVEAILAVVQGTAEDVRALKSDVSALTSRVDRFEGGTERWMQAVDNDIKELGRLYQLEPKLAALEAKLGTQAEEVMNLRKARHDQDGVITVLQLKLDALMRRPEEAP